jgi:hypothetical protein
MALIRVAQYSSTPTVVGDYQAQNAHLQAFTNQLMTQQFILDSGTDRPVIKQGCYVSHGGSLYVADADTAITGSPANGSVYIRVSGTTSLTVEFVTDISGYTWNPVYTALTNGSYTLLPYLIIKASTVWTRYNFNPNNQQFGSLAVVGTLAVTGPISGATVNTGQGANKLYAMNQNLRTTDNVSFSKLNLTASTYGSQDIAGNGVWIMPVGIYQMARAASDSAIYIEVYYGSDWIGFGDIGTVISDGSSVRMRNSLSSTQTVHYRKFS